MSWAGHASGFWFVSAPGRHVDPTAVYEAHKKEPPIMAKKSQRYGFHWYDQEVARVKDSQDYLTDRGYLLDNTFASLFVYLFNLGYTLHKQIADDEAKKETQPA